MDSRAYFIVGDIFCAVSVSLLSGLLCHWMFDPGWSMWPAMILGMVVGMAAGMVLALGLLMRFFGAMEVMVPGMTIGMVAGMAVAMSRSMTTLALFDHLLLGLVCGLITMVLIWLANQQMRGIQSTDNSSREQ